MSESIAKAAIDSLEGHHSQPNQVLLAAAMWGHAILHCCGGVWHQSVNIVHAPCLCTVGLQLDHAAASGRLALAISVILPQGSTKACMEILPTHMCQKVPGSNVLHLYNQVHISVCYLHTMYVSFWHVHCL